MTAIAVSVRECVKQSDQSSKALSEIHWLLSLLHDTVAGFKVHVIHHFKFAVLYMLIIPWPPEHYQQNAELLAIPDASTLSL